MRSKDRWFHLTISIFALTLAALSGIAIEYQKSPTKVREFFMQLGLPSIPSLQSWQTHTRQQINTALNHTQSSVPAQGNQVSSQGTGATSDGAAAAQLSSFQVKAFSHNVSQATVSRTQQLLSQYQIPQGISQFLGFAIKSKATVELAANKTDYEHALKSVGVDTTELHQLSLDTGGFTTGSTVIIPLYQNKTTPQLVNTLTHELTHVYLNQNGGDLPSWVNEGLAVTMGMTSQKQAESAITYSGYAKRMAENVLQAVNSNKLEPLTGNENKVIQGGAPYDLELQDWLAIRMLMNKEGTGPIHKFLALLHRGDGVNSAFSSAFGMSQKAVNTSLTQLLTTAAKVPDAGVDLTLSVSQTYHGYLRILPHGSHVWDGFRLQSGTTAFTLLPNGKIQGISEQMDYTHDSQAPDNETVYLNLDPNQPFQYKGQTVKDAGFALDYHNGLYGFVNGWITLSSGKTTYINTPKLFGVQLQGIQEHSQNNPLLPLLK